MQKLARDDKPRGAWKFIIIVSVFSLLIVIPYTWLVVEAFTDQQDAFTLGNWPFFYEETIIKNGDVLPMIWAPLGNSFLFAAMMSVFVTCVTTPAAYALSRTSFKGRRFVTRMMIILDAFPTVALLTSFIFLTDFLGLVNKLMGVVLIRVAMYLPGSVWLMKGFFDNVSWDIEWAGIVDGASRFKTFLKIIVPSIKPGVAVILVNSFLSGWGEYILINLLIYEGVPTMSAFIGRMLSTEGSATLPKGIMAAACLCYVIPIIIVFIFAQKSLLNVSQGGSKQ